MALQIGSILFWSLFAAVIACVEIESEGRYGWAEKMPTWYRTTGFWGRLYGLLMNGKPLTGYHAFMFFFPVLLFHAHFLMGVPWTGAGELKAWALYFAWCPLWDYFWFVLNPHYAGRFTKDGVWWHARSRWIFGMFPLDYAAALAISLGFAEAAARAAGTRAVLLEHLFLLQGFGLATLALHFAAPAYHRWYARMRLRDDRGKAGIFHGKES